MKIKSKIKNFKLKRKSLAILVGLTLAALAVGYGSKYWLGDDNIIEERCEQIIKKNTGFDIDLSPLSPESYDGYLSVGKPFYV